MKTTNTLIAALVAITTMAFAGDFDLYEQVKTAFKDPTVGENNYNLTPAQWLEYLDQLCGTNAILFQADGKYSARNTTRPNAAVLLTSHAFYHLHTDAEKQAFYAEWDAKFVAAGTYLPHFSGYNRFPLMRAKFFETETQWVNTYPVNYALWQRYPNLDEHARPVAAKINGWCARYAKGIEFQKTIPSTVKALSNEATSVVKRWLRKNGKTFVVGEDGKNPVQEEIDKLVTALQSPFPGVGAKAWFATHLPDYEWIDFDAPTAQEIEDLKDAVFYGEKPLDAKNSVLLQYGLGVDAYNAFIEEYNNDTPAEETPETPENP